MFDKEYLKLIDTLFEGAYIVNADRKILYWNKGSERITGYTKDEVVNSFCYNNILRHVDDEGNELCMSGCPLQKTLISGKIQENRVYLYHKQGHRVPVVVRTSPLYDEQGNIIAALEVFTDAKFRRSLYAENRRLQELTTKDQLTNVYNRRYLDYHLDSLINESETFKQTFGILFIDIDNFKSVNDTYGHQIGDDVLKLVTRTIGGNIREDDILGRYGGEEFVLVLKLSSEKELELVANKVRVLVSKSSIIVNGKQVSVTISLGATMYIKDDSKESITERADKAMYISKQTGKNKVTLN